MQMPRPGARPREATSIDCALQASFREPPAEYRPVPFYWWAGEPLDRVRVAWQLDQLVGQGVRRTIISYPHLPDGTCDPGDPPLFSPAWWEFFRWFLAACRERGMTVGFQDYNLMGPLLTAIGQETPGMEGGQMSCVVARAIGGEVASLTGEAGCRAIGAWAYPVRDGVADPAGAVDVSAEAADGDLAWQAPPGDWLLALVFARPAPFDPLHPDAGLRLIERFFAPFERECGAELGATLDLFFQDELDFGGRMPFWSAGLLDEFRRRMGYDAAPLLACLWHDLGPVTEKFRLDFADLVSGCISRNFFEPVYRWHEEHGILYGHDNCGRGRIAEGRAHYGDYFRAMRWFSAPGCDDPKLDRARAFKGLKVNSSIAHLHRRPRVWLEAFHSSGWGVTPADVVAAINEDFAYGATVVNLHGLYYSTCGGWWEWAPPDFHFRQPYWRHGAALNDYLTRVCWLLSQGVQRCDVAIVYPIAALDAEPADPAGHGIVAHMENECIDGGAGGSPGPEETAFGLGKHLFDHACDFDFIDFESLAEAVAGGGVLEVADARYRVLVFPAMKAVRFSMMEKARDFVRAGGLVIAVGCLPTASDRRGRDDADLKECLEDIFGAADDSGELLKRHPGGGVGVFSRRGYGSVLDAIGTTIDRGAVASVPLHILHRHLGDREVYFVFNPSTETVTADIRFGCDGGLERWDAWTAEVTSVSDSNALTTTFAPREARIFTGHRDRRGGVPVLPERSKVVRIQTLDGEWESMVHPALDNRFGDFSLPATPGRIGPQARRFRYLDETADGEDWVRPGFDDASWPDTTFSFGPRLECAGPFPPDADFAAIEKSILGGGGSFEWRPYAISRRWGIERDPFLTDWLSGPHGLKGKVPDEFLDFHSDTPGTVWYSRAKVIVREAGEHALVTGARCAHRVWLNGEPVVSQPQALAPGFHAPWNIPHYHCEESETRVALRAGENDLLVKLIQPPGQRTRAFVAFDPPPPDSRNPALRCFSAEDSPRPCLPAAPERRAIRFRFTSPPGLREITFVSRGPARLWVGGEEVAIASIASLPGGCIRHHALLEAAMGEPQCVAIRVEAASDSHAGDALPEPVSFGCGAGTIRAGDWCAQGLPTYSGSVEYRKAVFLAELATGESVHLDLGALSATAEVRVNGRPVATLVTPPWRCDLTPHLHRGSNALSVTVANTLANHYSVGIPTPYAFAHQTPSGLFGPVTLTTTS